MDPKDRLNWFYRQILGKELDLDNFEEKITVQKAVYITQKLGMNFNYDFGWHVRGVYSPELTVDMYEIRNKPVDYSPSPDELEIVKKLKSIESNPQKIPKALELFSTVVYADKHRGMEGDEIPEFVKKVKPWFDDEEIDDAIQKLDMLN